jgi:hypothetical protein
VTHTVVARAIEEWLSGGAKSPKEPIEEMAAEGIAQCSMIPYDREPQALQ